MTGWNSSSLLKSKTQAVEPVGLCWATPQTARASPPNSLVIPISFRASSTSPDESASAERSGTGSCGDDGSGVPSTFASSSTDGDDRTYSTEAIRPISVLTGMVIEMDEGPHKIDRITLSIDGDPLPVSDESTQPYVAVARPGACRHLAHPRPLGGGRNGARKPPNAALHWTLPVKSGPPRNSRWPRRRRVGGSLLPDQRRGRRLRGRERADLTGR